MFIVGWIHAFGFLELIMNRLTYIGIFFAVLIIAAAIFAPWIATHDIATQNLGNRFAPPSSSYWFGTDALGRDIFSRVVFGARISLEVGITVVAVSAVIGILIGAIAGYFGGWVMCSTYFLLFRVCC